MVRDPYAVCEGICRGLHRRLRGGLPVVLEGERLETLAARHVATCLEHQRRNVETFGAQGRFFTYEAMCAEPERVTRSIVGRAVTTCPRTGRQAPCSGAGTTPIRTSWRERTCARRSRRGSWPRRRESPAGNPSPRRPGRAPPARPAAPPAGTSRPRRAARRRRGPGRVRCMAPDRPCPKAGRSGGRQGFLDPVRQRVEEEGVRGPRHLHDRQALRHRGEGAEVRRLLPEPVQASPAVGMSP